MAPKNIDETIQKLLYGYAAYCKKVLDKDLKSLQRRKFYAQEDRTQAMQEHTKAKQAYEFLLKIAENPKKYLYSGKDLIYADGDLYNKLSPIITMHFDKSQKFLLVRLGEQIAHHVNYTPKNQRGDWIYYGISGMRDLEAESILEMNKTVQLWNANDFVAVFKNIAPARSFAVNAYKTK